MLQTIGTKIYGMFHLAKVRLNNEDGAELMEWIGMCLVVLALMGAIITFFNSSGSEGIGEKIQDFITTQIGNLSNDG
ncbi:hypothetical protein FH966_10445 [Lentibacillus cibarius]|uniref:Uncharacterized protein n=1 Tax=Lentibacillus cibarius TaxID=2583219 RepID=A0A549YJJ9_9BACI|nr:hypothetical protein [Lentibacillus cibarius]TRM12067.1 hypothetical protein FH966_10445 [Lentibacillus cibarius]